ncbi:hypothetical protein SH528x_004946 [Novipirellula sp. SH528]|uniref:hypothetical protein n=1 Tax=Novipirellula sp. SH528 TaxID=3454466 RepID=UPI003FA14783
MELYSDGMEWRFSTSHIPLKDAKSLDAVSDDTHLKKSTFVETKGLGESQGAVPPTCPFIQLPKVLDRLLRAIWETTDWNARPPKANAITVVLAVWRDEEKLSTTLRPTISRLNDAFLATEPLVDLNFATSGDWVIVEYHPAQ